jgi:ABC-type lipoprotein release transport system permease subunit
MNINISMGDVVFGYYLYVLIAVFLAAFIFRPFFIEHKNLRRIIIMLNLLNIIFYTMVVVVVVSVREKVSHTYVLKTVWNGNGHETVKKVN